MLQGMSVVPPSSKDSGSNDGWDFYQGETWFSGPTLDIVIQKVTDYRVANSLPIGDPSREIQDFNAAKTRKIVPTKISVTLRERVVKWIESQLRIKPKYVDEAEADRRAAICAQCPHNLAKWTEGEKCKRCVENANRGTAIILMGRKQHPPIGACDILEQHNRAAVWLDQPKADNPDLPDFCWKKA
jgi:hypothetical protein